MEVTDAFLGCMLVSSSNQKKFGGLKKDLHSNFLVGGATYLKTMEAAKRLLAGYKPTWTPPRAPIKQEGVVTCIQKKEHHPSKAPYEKKVNVKGDSHCYNYGKEGHYVYTCLHDKLTVE